jgi:spore coat polysaccharide biosynthesis predicted glycosyltransferase SpsG
LLNQNLHANRLGYRCGSHTIQLLGIDYLLLRNEFLRARGKEPQMADAAHRFLVTLGGSEHFTILEKILIAMNSCMDRKITVRIIQSPLSAKPKMIDNAVGCFSHSTEVVHGHDMPSHMAWADVAICGGGSTCWEMAALGVPFVALILSDNQEDIVVELERRGVALNGGWGNQVATDRLGELIRSLSDNRRLREMMSRNGRQLIDGQGAGRVVDMMLRMP